MNAGADMSFGAGDAVVGPSSPRLGWQLVDALIDHGVTRFVAAPGSRNAPLLLALAEAAAADRVRLTMRIDERGAGFWALGQAKASGEPVAVVTTSGTAVGNLLPSIMEAHHAQVPIMVLSADRPETDLDTGANQTTRQPGIFTGFVRADAGLSDQVATQASVRHQVARLTLTARGELGPAGPVHLNVRFSAPLVVSDDGEGDDAPVPAEAGATARCRSSETDDSVPAGTPSGPGGVPAGTSRRQFRRQVAARVVRPVDLPAGPRTVVIAGDAAPAVGERARRAAVGYPLLAEPSSNARAGDALRFPRLLLRTGLAEQIERIVVFGHPTLSRPQQALLARDDMEIIQVGDSGTVPARAALVCDDVVLPAPERLTEAERAWNARWRAADAELAAGVDALLAERWGGPTLAAAVLEAVGRGDLIMGSSSPARDLDVAPVPAMSPRVWANRGLAGIDGLIATASGVAAETGAATLLIGDISFAHDLTGLLTGPLEGRPDVRIIVANDSGGSIFHTLEQGGDAHAAHFERVFATPLTLDLEPLARAVGATFHRAEDLGSLQSVLTGPIEGLQIIDAPIPRSDRRELDAEINALAQDMGPCSGR